MLINKKLLKFTEGLKGNILLCSLFYFLMFIANAGISYCIARMISNIVGPKFPIYLFSIFILIGMSITFTFLINKEAAEVRRKFLDLIMNKISEKLLELGMSFIDTTRTGYITAMYTSRSQALAPYYAQYIPILISTVLVTIGISIYFMTIELILGLISILSVVMVILIPYFWYGPMYRKGIKNWNEMSDFSADFLDNLQGMETLKLLAGGEDRKEAFKERSRRISKFEMEGLYVSSIENALLMIFATLGFVLTSLYGILMTYRGDLRPDDLLLILFLSTSGFSSVYSLMKAWHLGFRGITAVEDIDDFLAKEGKEFSESLVEAKEGLHLDNIKFSYEEGKEILKDISLSAKKGSINALVGRSGSGKTTIAKIIAGLYILDSGSVQYDGLILNEENLDEWYSMIGAVWQNPYIFTGSLYDNIAMAKPDASREEIISACEKAMIMDLVNELPQGLDTRVGEHGARFSGGEAQRIALARCFLKSSDILILDEATSSLDEYNQAKIKEAINELVKNKTVIIIAHRLSTILEADLIHFIENGKILESGSHEELVKNSPEYRELFYLGGDFYV